jgi:hypothetical protein
VRASGREPRCVSQLCIAVLTWRRQCNRTGRISLGHRADRAMISRRCGRIAEACGASRRRISDGPAHLARLSVCDARITMRSGGVAADQKRFPSRFSSAARAFSMGRVSSEVL